LERPRGLARLAARGHGARLALAPALTTALSTAEKLGLRDFALQHRVGLVTADAPIFANGAHTLAMVHDDAGDSRIWASREPEPRLPGPTWGRPVRRPVARGSASIAVSFAAVDLDTLLPPPGAQLIQIGPELDCDLATFGARASNAIIELLKKCGAWPKTGIVQAVYRDSYVSSPLVARLLIDTMKQIFAHSGSAEASLIIETRPPRPNDLRADPWQVYHDWRNAVDQKAVIELLGEHRGVDVSLHQRDVPHGRYLDVCFANGGAATIGANAAAQVKRLTTVNTLLQRRGIGKTYFVATSR
jgi:DEAD/DEAH box helicase domain-containing protein